MPDVSLLIFYGSDWCDGPGGRNLISCRISSPFARILPILIYPITRTVVVLNYLGIFMFCRWGKSVDFTLNPFKRIVELNIPLSILPLFFFFSPHHYFCFSRLVLPWIPMATPTFTDLSFAQRQNYLASLLRTKKAHLQGLGKSARALLSWFPNASLHHLKAPGRILDNLILFVFWVHL